MVTSIQRRSRLMQQGSSSFSVVIVLSLSAMVISSACTLYESFRTYVYGEVASARANETAIGVMWFAVDAVSNNPAITSITYPGLLSSDQSVSCAIALTSPGLIQITVSSSVTGAQSSTRRVVAIYSIPTKQVISWSEV
ncbi:MAG: hypothetical protein JWN30_1499 [Bacilli bacterium]|nr:hypothetical protein [Bacilli bacterium]